MSRALAALLACCLCLRSGAVTCPRGWFNLGDHCYMLSKTDHTFESCMKDVCGPEGGTLACIRQEEARALTFRLGIGHSADVVAAWIGYQNSGRDDKWQWVNSCPSTWENWMKNEPDHYCGGEDCAAMAGPSSRWMSASCRLRLPCLCEYPGAATAAYNASVPTMRDDTCYADCGDLTRWCSAWPFSRLYELDDDVCHWEETDGQKRGRGTNQCAQRVAADSRCGEYFSYEVGTCRCNPKVGPHMNCSARQPDPTTDVFRLVAGGAELVYSRQRCVYNTVVDDEYFRSLAPATTFGQRFHIWARASAIWIIAGVPCFLAMIVATWRMWCSVLLPDASLEAMPSSGVGNIMSAYGPLLDTGIDADTGAAVSNWIFRAGLGVVGYGLALLALGATLALHMAGKSAGFMPELMESLFMCVSMSAVARAAFMVHRRLSPVARQVVGRLVLVNALANVGMAVKALAGVVVFSTLADQSYENVCFATYLFRWSMCLALPLQCIAGISLARTQLAAERYAGSRARVGGFAFLLVGGFFASGTCVWLAGYLDCVHEAFYGVAVLFIFAAFAQLTAGIALLMANRKVKEYFKQDAAREKDSELAGTIGNLDAGDPIDNADSSPGFGNSYDRRA